MQIDLGSAKLISGVISQGSPDENRWVETFRVEFSMDGTSFTPYT
jgi:hypothetical protein